MKMKIYLFLFLLLLLYEYYFSLIIIYLNYRFGFYKEVMNKYKNEEIFNLFKDIYSYIPIASILENRLFIFMVVYYTIMKKLQ